LSIFENFKNQNLNKSQRYILNERTGVIDAMHGESLCIQFIVRVVVYDFGTIAMLHLQLQRPCATVGDFIDQAVEFHFTCNNIKSGRFIYYYVRLASAYVKHFFPL